MKPVARLRVMPTAGIPIFELSAQPAALEMPSGEYDLVTRNSVLEEAAMYLDQECFCHDPMGAQALIDAAAGIRAMKDTQ